MTNLNGNHCGLIYNRIDAIIIDMYDFYALLFQYYLHQNQNQIQRKYHSGKENMSADAFLKIHHFHQKVMKKLLKKQVSQINLLLQLQH